MKALAPLTGFTMAWETGEPQSSSCVLIIHGTKTSRKESHCRHVAEATLLPKNHCHDKVQGPSLHVLTNLTFSEHLPRARQKGADMNKTC